MIKRPPFLGPAGLGAEKPRHWLHAPQKESENILWETLLHWALKADWEAAPMYTLLFYNYHGTPIGFHFHSTDASLASLRGYFCLTSGIPVLKNKSHSKYSWNGETQWTSLPEKTADLKEKIVLTHTCLYSLMRTVKRKWLLINPRLIQNQDF